MNLTDIGRLLVGVGVVIVVVGGLLLLAGRLGRLPGDLRFGSGNVRVYVPLATMVVVSVIATIVLNLFFRR